PGRGCRPAARRHRARGSCSSSCDLSSASSGSRLRGRERGAWSVFVTIVERRRPRPRSSRGYRLPSEGPPCPGLMLLGRSAQAWFGCGATLEYSREFGVAALDRQASAGRQGRPGSRVPDGRRLHAPWRRPRPQPQATPICPEGRPSWGRGLSLASVPDAVSPLSTNFEGCDLVAFENEDMFQAEWTVREITGHPSDDDRLPIPLKGTERLDRMVILETCRGA